MQTHLLDGHLGREVEVDVCAACLPGHEPWDDDSWSLGLVGAGLTELFRLIKREP